MPGNRLLSHARIFSCAMNFQCALFNLRTAANRPNASNSATYAQRCAGCECLIFCALRTGGPWERMARARLLTAAF